MDTNIMNTEDVIEVAEEFMEFSPRQFGAGALIGVAATSLVWVGTKLFGPKLKDKVQEWKDSKAIRDAEKNGTVVEAEVEEVVEEK